MLQPCCDVRNSQLICVVPLSLTRFLQKNKTFRAVLDFIVLDNSHINHNFIVSVDSPINHTKTLFLPLDDRVFVTLDQLSAQCCRGRLSPVRYRFCMHSSRRAQLRPVMLTPFQHRHRFESGARLRSVAACMSMIGCDCSRFTNIFSNCSA